MNTSSAAAASTAERSLEIGGRSHRVLERAGKPGISSGHPILALHGANTHAGIFVRLFTAFDTGRTLYAPDQPGRRLTEDLTLGSVADRAGFLEAAIEALGLLQPIVVGHSLGGAVALELALRSPARMAGLVLCSAGYCFEAPPSTIDELRLLVATGARRAPSIASFSPASRPADVAWVNDVYHAVPAASALVDYACLAGWSAERRLGDVACPTLVIRGADEFPLIEAQCVTMARTIPGATSVVVPAAGHLLPAERPENLAAAIVAFARSLP